MRAELLFEAESFLRGAAVDYANAKTDTHRKKLRTAALGYAELAKRIDLLEWPKEQPEQPGEVEEVERG